jgi:hypothetical protein
MLYLDCQLITSCSIIPTVKAPLYWNLPTAGRTELADLELETRVGPFGVTHFKEFGTRSSVGNPRRLSGNPGLCNDWWHGHSNLPRQAWTSDVKKWDREKDSWRYKIRAEEGGGGGEEEEEEGWKEKEKKNT